RLFHASTGVRDLDDMVLGPAAQRDRDSPIGRRRVLRVTHEVQQDARDLVAIHVHPSGFVLHLDGGYRYAVRTLRADLHQYFRDVDSTNSRPASRSARELLEHFLDAVRSSATRLGSIL